MRNLLAVVLGVVVAVLAISLVELVGHSLYPLPADLRLDDARAIRAYFADAPCLALAFVPLAWAAGAFCGGAMAAAAAAGRRTRRFGVVVGAVILVAAGMNLWAIPHPAWLVLVTPLACLLPGWLGGAVGARRED
ncbi:hypothetical protein [Nannocystis bainbridge]|uniref:Uncharacterized protein n=1 Tax=Nannocystis bainbridge TaxID=2995303 RepID=A0ABT5E8E2_9BACT|nr:hypothetical protein [Nannocystis bainbridge]MDC0722136.1 hypothetical protein [Nannocystis bainbridge]